MCIIRVCLSILRIVSGAVFEFPLKRASKRSKAIPAMLFQITMIAVCQWAFAQEGGISGSHNCLAGNGSIKGVTPTVGLLNTSASAGAETTDERESDSQRIPFLGNWTFLASRPADESMSALHVIESSDMSPSGSTSALAKEEACLRYRPRQPKPGLSWETGAGKSYLIPALEIPGFILALNAFNRLVFSDEKENGKGVYDSNFYTFWDHLIHGPWRYDNDESSMNQLGHPYQGSIYHGFARSAGLDFWESLGYTFVGSFLWETAGETTDPSINDQVASGIAGSFFGESLFRMASLLLEKAGGKPGFWRELGAAVLSPPTGFNRLVFGNRFKPVFPSRDPAIFQWVRLGEGLILTDTGSDITNRTQTSLSYSMSYGLPGKPDYSYKRPFDYFQVDLGVTAFGPADYLSIVTEGLLLGKKYEMGNSYRGVWGLYGSYDYTSPQSFHVSSTVGSLGTTAQWWLAPTVALQGTILGGIGLGAGGEAPQEGDRDYHYGVTGRGLLALRLIFDDLAMVDMKGRGYYISSLGGSEPRGSETISNLEAGLTLRIYGPHSLGIQYVVLRRDSSYPGLYHTHHMQGTLSLLYTFLNDTRFGAVEWRNGYSGWSEKKI